MKWLLSVPVEVGVSFLVRRCFKVLKKASGAATGFPCQKQLNKNRGTSDAAKIDHQNVGIDCACSTKLAQQPEGSDLFIENCIKAREVPEK